MKNSAKMLLSGITAAVTGISAASAADTAFHAFAEDGVAISEANFPDENFRKYISENIDKNSDGTLSAGEISNAVKINVSNMNIGDLRGIEYFTSVDFLNCTGNNLSSLDVSKNTALTTLNCSENKLTSLDVSALSKLYLLSCYENEISSIDLSRNTALRHLAVRNNKLSSLNLGSNTALASLNCSDNEISSLDVSRNTKLTSLSCQNNRLTALDLANNAKLTEVYCESNALTSLELGNTAPEELRCSYNQLTSLRINDGTFFLYCTGNRLSSLDVSDDAALLLLSCADNELTSLDISRNTALEGLFCGGNHLTSIDISSNAVLTSDGGKTEFDGNTYTLSSASLNELAKYGFDSAKASGWTGADFDAAANSLKNITADTVTYSYDIGGGKYTEFTLKTDNIRETEHPKPAVTAEPAYGGAEVKWNAVDGAVKYRVFTYVPGQKIRQFGSDTTETSMTVKGLKGGEKTGIIVLAQFADKKWSSYTADDIAYVVPMDAVKPYLCVNPKENGQVYLIWSSVPSSVRYKVMVRENGTDKWELAAATRQRCRVTLGGLGADRKYEFLVRGLNSRGKYTPMDADDIVIGSPVR